MQACRWSTWHWLCNQPFSTESRCWSSMQFRLLSEEIFSTVATGLNSMTSCWHRPHGFLLGNHNLTRLTVDKMWQLFDSSPVDVIYYCNPPPDIFSVNTLTSPYKQSISHSAWTHYSLWLLNFMRLARRRIRLDTLFARAIACTCAEPWNSPFKSTMYIHSNELHLLSMPGNNLLAKIC